VPRTGPGAGPGFGGQVDELLEACSPEQVLAAAARLRRTALEVRRLLADPFAARVLAVLPEEPGVPWQDPGRLAARLADQAVNVVTALDYLLGLLAPAEVPVRRLVLGDGPARDQDQAEEDARDRLTRRRLDARAAAVREGTRLLAMLPASLVIATGPPDYGPAPGGGGVR
jgi:hypothetical protein